MSVVEFYISAITMFTLAAIFRIKYPPGSVTKTYEINVMSTCDEGKRKQPWIKGTFKSFQKKAGTHTMPHKDP
jgi:hypothetical protein